MEGGIERQEGTRLDDIAPGHIRRYEFACRRVSGEVLDAACGVGYGSRMMHDLGCKVTGVDLETDALRKADKFFIGPTFLCQDVTKLYLGDMSFDWVVSFETIEHLKDPLEALRRFRSVGANLICSTPNELFYPFDPKKFEGEKYPHQRHYTPEQLDGLLKEAGWEVLQRFCQKDKQDHVSIGTQGKFLCYVCS